MMREDKPILLWTSPQVKRNNIKLLEWVSLAKILASGRMHDHDDHLVTMVGMEGDEGGFPAGEV